MRITDMRHFLNEKGELALENGPGLELARFLGTLIAAATQGEQEYYKRIPCLKCGKDMRAGLSSDGRVVWKCTGCTEEGVISNWQGTVWDMSAGESTTQ